jgi:hypothetical protein
MSKVYTLFFKAIGCCFLLWSFFLHADIIVEANINQSSGHVHYPLKGTITITHETEADIDIHSFQLKEKNLEVSLVKNISISNNTQVSIYSFSLPPQDAGNHMLPSLSVKVGPKIYHSVPSSYSVSDSNAVLPKTDSIKSNHPPNLNLEAFLQGPNALYLGDRTTLVYRISYNRSIDLTNSELPFIHINSFLKVGDAQVSDQQQGDLTIQLISQTIEASQLGNYKIGPSFIEGYAYQKNSLGQKIYDKQLLRAEAPPVEIVVKPFPMENQPASFNGAIGKIKADVKIKTASETEVGESIKLVLTLSGINNYSELHLPTLSCQPGFSGMFQVNDLPLISEINDHTKSFQIEVRPLSSLATEVPSMEFSSFDLDSKQFQMAKTAPIPIKVAPARTKESKIQAFPKQDIPSNNSLEAMINHQMPPIEQKTKTVNIHAGQIPLLQRGWMMLVFPFGLVFLFLQYKKYQEWNRRPKSNKPLSESFFMQAMGRQKNPTEAAKLLEKSIWSYLMESDVALGKIKVADDLPREGTKGKARTLLLQLQFFQYSREKASNLSEIFHSVQQFLGLNLGSFLK